jgi:hypothetical protein
MAIVGKIFIVCLAIMMSAVYVAVSHADDGFVPCTGTDCDINAFYKLIGNIVELLVALAIPVAIIFFLFAGAKLVFSRGNVQAAQGAKKMFTSAVIGLLLIVGAYAIVVTIVDALVTGEYKSFFDRTIETIF